MCGHVDSQSRRATRPSPTESSKLHYYLENSPKPTGKACPPRGSSWGLNSMLSRCLLRQYLAFSTVVNAGGSAKQRNTRDDPIVICQTVPGGIHRKLGLPVERPFPKGKVNLKRPARRDRDNVLRPRFSGWPGVI
ncbi:hypothetical protein VTN96DRAFT_7277 [Rasamsonia emersonii]